MRCRISDMGATALHAVNGCKLLISPTFIKIINVFSALALSEGQRGLLLHLLVVSGQHVATPGDEVCDVAGCVADDCWNYATCQNLWSVVPQVGNQANHKRHGCRHKASEEVRDRREPDWRKVLDHSCRNSG